MVRVEKYGKSRYWAVYENGQLLAVTVYKKGALAIASRLVHAAAVARYNSAAAN